MLTCFSVQHSHVRLELFHHINLHMYFHEKPAGKCEMCALVDPSLNPNGNEKCVQSVEFEVTNMCTLFICLAMWSGCFIWVWQFYMQLHYLNDIWAVYYPRRILFRAILQCSCSFLDIFFFGYLFRFLPTNAWKLTYTCTITIEKSQINNPLVKISDWDIKCMLCVMVFMYIGFEHVS